MVNLTSEKNRKSSENDKICKYVNEIIRIINVLLDTQLKYNVVQICENCYNVRFDKKSKCNNFKFYDEEFNNFF